VSFLILGGENYEKNVLFRCRSVFDLRVCSAELRGCFGRVFSGRQWQLLEGDKHQRYGGVGQKEGL
jgi:hypothetical protein